MADIQTPNKHRPELKDMSAAELRRRMTEIEHELHEREKAEKEAARAKVIERAGELRDMFVNALDEAATLEEEHELSIIPPNLREFCTDSKGVFAPSKKWRKPRP